MKNSIISLFYDLYGRPRITPKHESSIIVMLENNYSPGKVKSGLKRLVDTGTLRCERIHVDKVGDAKFYFLNIFQNEKNENKIKRRIQRSLKLIEKQSDKRTTTMLGDHLHDLVKSELKIQNFQILSENNVRTYNNKTWIKTNHSLDLLVKHNRKDVVLGIEIKNALSLPPLDEIKIKLEMCKYLEIIPIFAVRWMESYRMIIEENGGFLWQFKTQLFPRGQENFTHQLRRRFKLPCYVQGELPAQAAYLFQNWIENYPKTLSSSR